MKVHVLKQEQRLPITRQEAWEFFSMPGNIDLITPADAGFQTTYLSAEKMHEGQIITYRAKVFPMVNMTWVTEIKAVDEGFSFIDVQLFGPYKLWHHRHTFEDIEGGVLMKDLVHYVMPMGFIGEIAGKLFVGEKLRRVFDFRRKALEEKFGKL